MILSNSDFLKFAFSRYDKPQLSSISEFEADLKRFMYLNNLFKRYKENPIDLQDRLMLNHIVILGNCFSIKGSIEMLNYKILPEYKYMVQTCLYFLGVIARVDTKLDYYLLDILNES